MIQTIADALTAQGYDTLTPVQQAVSDPAVEGQDLLVSAQTGSGKTVAFGLAIAPTLLGADTHFGPAGTPLALIIAPTRELAMQVSRELGWLYGPAGAVVTTCVGGMDQRTERRALDRGAHVVVATPGRLCDHIKRGNIDLDGLRAVVLDEADEMLDMGFREELEFILDEAPEDRRTLLFSATVPAAIAKMAQAYQRDAQRITTAEETRQHADIEYRAMNVHPRDAENAIINVLRFYEAKNAIVFCNTRAAVTRLTTKFTNRGFSVVALSGELTQSERTNALQALRDGRARVCVATDVAARGIDLPNLELVIHADLPSNADTLLHRSGRTGRAGRKGVSALIVPPKMRTKANRLLGWAKLKADWGPAPSADEVNSADEERLMTDPAWTTPAPENAEAFVANLTRQFSAEQLATAFVNLYRARASAPEELTDPDAKDDRADFGPSIWFAISKGRADGAEPRSILPMLCKKADLTKDDVGAIRVRQEQTFVQILETTAQKFVSALGPDMQIEDAKVTRLEGPPNLGHSGSKRNRRPHPKGRYDPDARPAPRKPRGKADVPGAARQEYPKSDKPTGPKGKRAAEPARTHAGAQDRSAKKTSDKTQKPRAKAVWKKDPPKAETSKPRKPGTSAPPKGKGAKQGKPKSEKPSENAAYKRAADPSKRFTPPHRIGKQGGKGGNATPRRNKGGARTK